MTPDTEDDDILTALPKRGTQDGLIDFLKTTGPGQEIPAGRYSMDENPTVGLGLRDVSGTRLRIHTNRPTSRSTVASTRSPGGLSLLSEEDATNTLPPLGEFLIGNASNENTRDSFDKQRAELTRRVPKKEPAGILKVARPARKPESKNWIKKFIAT